MSFEPTHEFRGLELRYDYDYDVINGFMTSWYSTEDGEHLCLPESKVTKFQPTPKPGEVWKYVGSFPEKRPLLLILNEDEVRGIDSDRDLENITRDEITRGDWVKVLNADGSPA